MAVEELRVSVILCVRDAEQTLSDQLEALASQRFDETWELVVVDNASSDDSVDIARSFDRRFPSLRVVLAPDKPGLSYARNVGVRAARGSVVAFCDADDQVRPDWLHMLVMACDTADLVGGALSLERLSEENPRYWRGASPTQHGLPVAHGYLSHVVGANVASRREAFFAVGGCDENFTTSSDDVDLSWRMYQAGSIVAYEPRAIVDYRLRASLRTAIRQQIGYGRAETILYRKHRPHMLRDADAFRVYWFLASRWHHLLRGNKLRGRWLSIAAYRGGRLHGSMRQRVWFP